MTRPVVLIVDDRQDVRRISSVHLERAGYTALEADSGAEALGILDRRTDIAVVVVDCAMPGLKGRDVAWAVVTRWPQVKLVATSGHPPDPELPAEALFLPKPFTSRALIAAVEAALRAGSQEPGP